MSISTVLGASRPALGWERVNESGAARAARCSAYPIQIQLSGEQICPDATGPLARHRLRHRAACAAPLTTPGRLELNVAIQAGFLLSL